MPKSKIETSISGSGLTKIKTGDDRNGTHISYLPYYKARNDREREAWSKRVEKTLEDHCKAVRDEAKNFLMKETGLDGVVFLAGR